MHRYRDLGIGLAIVLTIIVALAIGVSQLASVDTGHNVDRVAWLPNNASNVSFARTYAWEYYEFDITEEDFRAWATRWKLNEIQEPFYITRYTIHGSPIQTSTYDGPREMLVARGIQPPEKLPDYTAEVQNGLSYFNPNQRTHGGTYIAFDRAIGRAYFHSHSR